MATRFIFYQIDSLPGWMKLKGELEAVLKGLGCGFCKIYFCSMCPGGKVKA